MPAYSKAQQTLARMALAMKRGKLAKSYSKKAAKMMASMSEDELMKYAEMPIKH